MAFSPHKLTALIAILILVCGFTVAKTESIENLESECRPYVERALKDQLQKGDPALQSSESETIDSGETTAAASDVGEDELSAEKVASSEALGDRDETGTHADILSGESTEKTSVEEGDEPSAERTENDVDVSSEKSSEINLIQPEDEIASVSEEQSDTQQATEINEEIDDVQADQAPEPESTEEGQTVKADSESIVDETSENDSLQLGETEQEATTASGEASQEVDTSAPQEDQPVVGSEEQEQASAEKTDSEEKTDAEIVAESPEDSEENKVDSGEETVEITLDSVESKQESPEEGAPESSEIKSEEKIDSGEQESEPTEAEPEAASTETQEADSKEGDSKEAVEDTTESVEAATETAESAEATIETAESDESQGIEAEAEEDVSREKREDTASEEAKSDEEKADASKDEAKSEEEKADASKEEAVSEEAQAADELAGDEGAVQEAAVEDTDEDELTKEFVIPEILRPRNQLIELLHLDEESTVNELALSKAADVTLRELKRLYDSAIKPLEILYKYRDLSNRHFGDPEIFSKPLILFMGPWSGGKSSIINYLLDNEYNENSLRTGAEPSPAYFNIVTWGPEPEILDGTQLAADWTFSGLQKFGQGLEDRLRGLKLPNKLLEMVNIVEIPGILEVRKQVSRVFPFNDACQWFIDRADIIFLVYDPSKLDVGPETEAILDQLKGREYQTRVILNKADTVKPEELLRVQGALLWNISPLMSSAQPPIIYTTSLWSTPFNPGSPVKLLQAQERAFLRDIRQAIDKRVENKIASARRFAVRVRNHAKMVDCYLTTYYNHKTFFGNRKEIANDIIENPQQYHIYEGLSTLKNISRYDLPDPESYKDFFKLNALYDFQQLSATCTYFKGCPINRLDVCIAYDLPELVGKHKKLVEQSLGKTQLNS